MNDYESLVADCDLAIQVTEAAYYNAQDDEDQATLDEALDKIKLVKERAEAKA